ncbi:hypothetical protein Pan216_47160 [Planctomycetes bacterium Pan216]|uniref:DUF1549 domain-containing protein n=1 Tax=Kolteria novifilia TaxID=2527975 RepID=A0A518BA26_9BACT|nr:hypothetical protein Pan216_47160 [Planctomycetes bacterium Pan216]
MSRLPVVTSRPMRVALPSSLLGLLLLTTLTNADERQAMMPREQFAPLRRATQPQAKLPPKLEWVSAKPVEVGGQLSLIDPRTLGKPLTIAELDALIKSSATSADPGREAPEDHFVRRLFLDTIGQIPAPADVRDYLESDSPDKKAQLIERLLSEPRYGRHWARYWRDAIAYRTASDQRRLGLFDIETWLAEQFNQNRPWDEIVSDMLRAEGLSDSTPEGYFIAAHEGRPADVAGEASRLFLGIQIACAQCHDHPSDAWTRNQFHQVASFFGKARTRLRRNVDTNRRGVAIEIFSRPLGDYRMPDLDDPGSPGDVMGPTFLTGQPVSNDLSDAQRRQAASAFFTSKRNPYFAKAFVNRAWAKLTGVGFTTPVDDLSLLADVRHPELFEALSRSFAASDYDVKELMRLILNSSAYAAAAGSPAPDGSVGESPLTAATAKRLTSDQLFDSLDLILGGLEETRPRRGLNRPSESRRTFREAFGFDPSTPASDIDGTIPQALLLMNNPMLHQRIDTKRPGSVLAKLLEHYPSDPEMIEMLYLRVLGRLPSSKENAIAKDYVAKSASRGEAYEDLLWAMLNTTEFLNNH